MVKKLRTLVSLILSAPLIVFKTLVQSFYLVTLQKKYCKESEKIYLLVVGTIGDTFVLLSYLNSLQSIKKYRILLDIRFESLLCRFSELKDIVILIEYGSFWWYKGREILNWNGVLATIPQLENVFGIPELTSYRNLRVVGNRYRYFKQFLRTVKHSISDFNEVSYAKFIVEKATNTLVDEIYTENGCGDTVRKEALRYLQQIGFKPGKTVLLVPYSNFFGNFSNSPEIRDAYSDIVSYFLSRGFMVLTNVDRINTEPVSLSKPISPPLHLIPYIAELCGWVVGYRTGLLYLMTNTNAKIFVCYPKKKFIVDLKDFYSLRNFIQRDGIYEFAGDVTDFLKEVKSMLDLSSADE